MILKQWIVAVVLLAFSVLLHAFDTDEQRIADKLRIMDSGSVEQKEQMLERLQWSGLSDPILFDRLEQDVLAVQPKKYFDRGELGILSYEIRALGYSGNLKYQPTLHSLSKKAENVKLKRHAAKAATDVLQFNDVQKRLAARAVFHEKQTEAALLEVIATKLDAMYLDTTLDKTSQDTAAWMAKALKQAQGYESLLQQVANKTPHKKIRKYAS